MILVLLAIAVLSPGVSTGARTMPHVRSGAARTLARARHTDTLDVAAYARLLRSADERVLDTTLIAPALASGDVQLRRVAARTVSQVALRHRRRALPFLRELSHDRDSVVASSAIFGLGLIRDTVSLGTLASLVRAGGAAATPAAWSLGEIGVPARDTIASLLHSALPGRAQSSHVVALLFAASKLKPLDFASVAPYLDSRDTLIRWAAAYAVARQRSPAGVRALMVAKDANAAFRAEVARALTAQSAGDSLRPTAIQRLLTLTTDPDPYVRINAVRSLATFGNAGRDAVMRLIRDQDANVRVAAAQSAATVPGMSPTDWRDAWLADTGYKFRKSLLASSVATGVELQYAAAWRAAPDWRLRHAFVEAWSGSSDTLRTRAIALELSRDPDARVRGAAYNVLAASDTARRDSVVQRALAIARTDPDSLVRVSVPGARAHALDTAAVARPIEFYMDAVRRIVVPSLRGRPPQAVLHTARGRISITFTGVEAPLTALNYLTLAQNHFYDGLRFHRVVPGFVAQDGDPRGDGEEGPGYAIRDELTLLPYSRGAVGMALSGPDTGGSQYFLTLTPQPHLTGHYTVFGSVTSGLAAMDALVEGDAINRVTPRW